MRRVLAIASFFVLVSVRPAPAQSVMGEMVIGVKEVEIRSGPSTDFYPTAKLYQGARVKVVKEEKEQPGWIAIQPPAESVSWINAQHVLRGQNTQIAAVIGKEPVPVRPGGLVGGKPPVERVKIQPGTLVVVVGKEEVKDSGTWLPIQPVPQEVRYIPASAVQPAPGPLAPPPAVASANVPATLLAQADQALSQGNVQQAMALYRQVVEHPAADYQQRTWSQNRLASMTRPQSATPQWAGQSPNLSTQTTAFTRTNPAATASQWSVWGQLRATAFHKDGQPMYVLEDRRGTPLLYVATQPGFTLRDYIGKTVTLYGPVTYRSDDYLRAHYMTASHVATLPNR